MPSLLIMRLLLSSTCGGVALGTALGGATRACRCLGGLPRAGHFQKGRQSSRQTSGATVRSVSARTEQNISNTCHHGNTTTESGGHLLGSKGTSALKFRQALQYSENTTCALTVQGHFFSQNSFDSSKFYLCQNEGTDLCKNVNDTHSGNDMQAKEGDDFLADLTSGQKTSFVWSGQTITLF